MSHFPPEIQGLIDTFFQKVEELGNPKISVMLAVCKVEEDYGTAGTPVPIGVVVGGVCMDHRVYGDMLVSIAAEVSQQTRSHSHGSHDGAQGLAAFLESLGARNGETE